MSAPDRQLTPSQAARRLGVSIKALRLYERAGLLAPTRTAAGWRSYGTASIARAAEIVALRRLGLGIAQIADVITGDPARAAPVLAAHQAAMEGRIGHLSAAVAEIRRLRTAGARHPRAGAGPAIAFDLPWPWGSEPFGLTAIRPLTFITGPLGSGKTRLARLLAQHLPGATFLGLDRDHAGRDARAVATPATRRRIDRALDALVADGASATAALVALLAGMEARTSGALVVDMVEQGLDQTTQQALMAHLRRRQPGCRPLVLMTRSSAILDLAAMGPDEVVIFCPANHSPPFEVAAGTGATCREAVASCLAPPAVRARTEGVIAWRPPVA